MADDTGDRRALIARSFMSALPLARALGLRFEGIGDGWAEAVLPWDDRHAPRAPRAGRAWQAGAGG